MQLLPNEEVNVRENSTGSSLSNHSLWDERSSQTSGAATTLTGHSDWNDKDFARVVVKKVFSTYKFLCDGDEIFNSRFCLKVFGALRERPDATLWSGKMGYFQRASLAIKQHRSTVTSTMKYIYIGMLTCEKKKSTVGFQTLT